MASPPVLVGVVEDEGLHRSLQDSMRTEGHLPRHFAHPAQASLGEEELAVLVEDGEDGDGRVEEGAGLSDDVAESAGHISPFVI